MCGRNCFWNQRDSETEETIGHCGSSNDGGGGGLGKGGYGYDNIFLLPPNP